MLEKYLPSPFDAALDEAAAEAGGGDVRRAAVSLLRGAYEDSGQRHDIAMTYAHALIEARRLDDAQALLDAAPMVATRPTSRRLRSWISPREAARSPELAGLEEQLASDPDNLDLREQLAVQYSAAGQYREALEQA
jgi:putative thioredoxin